MLGMRYEVGDVVWWRIPAPQVANAPAPQRQGQYAPEHRGVGRVVRLLEERNAYLIKSFRSGDEGEVSEEQVGGKMTEAE